MLIIQLSIFTPVTGMDAAFTVMSQEADWAELEVFTVIVTLPSEMAVTLPELSTVATFSSELLHERVLSEALSGLSVTVN